LEKCIENVSFYVNPPSDSVNLGRSSVRNSMIISGMIDTDEKTEGLYKWALISGNNKECYKDITVEQFRAGQLVRKVRFSKAFVVDYSENYSNSEGVGHFTIYIRQFTGMDIECTTQVVAKAVQSTPDGDSILEEDVKEQGQVEAVNSTIVPAKTGSLKMSFTDRIAKSKELQDNISKDGYDEIKKFREQSGLQPYSDESGDTVAMVEIEGQKFFGVNSSITKESQEATKELRQKWFKKVNWVPPKKNVPKHLGHVQSLTHAESHSLIVAYEKLGKLPKNMTMVVDRKTCNMCKGEMPALLKHIGVEELKILCGGSTKPMIIKAVQ
jgi:deoxycytidylate deaminase